MTNNANLDGAYFEWRTGHQPHDTLREAFQHRDIPSEEWQKILKERNVHPDVLDMTYIEARDTPDEELTNNW